MHHFQGGSEIGVDGVVATKLPVTSRPASWLAGCARNRNIGLRVHGIGRGLAPLQGERRHERKLAYGLDGNRRLQMDEIHIARIARERDVVTIGKEGVEGAHSVVRAMAITGCRVQLQPKAWLPGCCGKGIARSGTYGPGPYIACTDGAAPAHRPP